MKRITQVTTLILALLLFTQFALPVQAKGSSKKPDPNFKEKATHIQESHLPYYGKNAVVDIYVADGIFYSVDPVSQDVVEIEPEVMDYRIDSTYTEEQLRDLAEKLVVDFLGDKVKLDKLSYSLGQKIGTYFFRWKDTDKQLDNGSSPFIQVGLSQNGDFLNLVNSLPFEKNFSSLRAPKVQMMPAQEPYLLGSFSEIYANGGSYWSPTSWGGSSAIGGWYNSNPGCSGTFCSKYYYTSAKSSGVLYGKWTPNVNTGTKAAAFIPSNNATAKVQYDILPRSSTTHIYTLVDQNAYFDAWRSITPSTVGNGIAWVQLWDIGFEGTGTSSYKVAWDELWVYNP